MSVISLPCYDVVAISFTLGFNKKALIRLCDELGLSIAKIERWIIPFDRSRHRSMFADACFAL